MIACAADEIVCDPSSILGSIGVVGATFGFEKAIKKLGIERRVYTAGKNKAMLDPFLPENPDDVKRLKAIQQDIHEKFIALVKARRGKKLKGPESALFSGEYWVGIESRGTRPCRPAWRHTRGVARTFRRQGRDAVDRRARMVQPQNARCRRGAVRKPVSQPGLADEVISALEARAIWARYGF